MTTETQPQHKLNGYHRSPISGTWTIVLDGSQKVVPRGHEKYQEIQECIKTNDIDTLWNLLNPPTVVKEFLESPAVSATGGVEIKFDEVFVNGEPVNNGLTRQILRFREEGLPYEPLVRFLGRLSANPSYRAQRELWGYLDHHGTPITPEGYFIGYKVVRDNWMDKHSGTICNKPASLLTDEEKASYPKRSGKATLRINEEGQVEVSVPRNTVDDNWGTDCSDGLHVGCVEYVRWFRNAGSNEHVILVRVDPADVVTVPHTQTQKLRTSRYTILDEYKEDIYKSELQGAVYSQSSSDDEEEEDDDTGDFDDEERCEDCGELLDDCTCGEDEDQDDDEEWDDGY